MEAPAAGEAPAPAPAPTPTEPPAPRRVKSVKIAAGGCIDRVEFEYVDGKKWSIGGPGGHKGIPPLVLAEDEYLEEVYHEGLPQWWYVGVSLEFRTNKGRIFRHVAGWGSGTEDNMVSYRVSPGNCITALRLHDGVLRGIVEEKCHVEDDADLQMFVVYWLDSGAHHSEESKEVKCPKGHVMREDWSRSGHECDECTRRGTMARCGGGCDYDLCGDCYRHHAEGWAKHVQKRGFCGREAALQFACRHGAGQPGILKLGPLRLEVDDHPWLDATRDLQAHCGRGLAALRGRLPGGTRVGPNLAYAQDGLLPMPSVARPSGGLGLGRGVDLQRSSPALPPMVAGDSFNAEASGAAADGDPLACGLVVDVKQGTRVKAWGDTARLAMCEKAAADAGEFNLAAWQEGSSSLKAWVQWYHRTVPLLMKVVSLLDWKKNISGSIMVAVCIAIRAACDGWQPVLTGAVFNLINGDQHEVERESHFLFYLCSWTFGCEGRLALAKSVILGLMLASIVQGIAKALGTGLQQEMREKQAAEMKVEVFQHLLSQDQALFDTERKHALVGKAQLKAMDQVTEWVWNLASDCVKLLTQMIFLLAISPTMTLVYVFCLPVLERSTRRLLHHGVAGQLRRQDGLEFTCTHVMAESVDMVRTVKSFSREDKHLHLVGRAAGALRTPGDAVRRLRHAAVSVFNDTSQRAVYCFCLWCGLVWMERDFSAGDMTAYLLLVQQVGGLVERVRRHMRDLQRRHDMLVDHFEFMDRTPKVIAGDHTGEVRGLVQYRGVEFSYPARPDTKVLKGVCFEMRLGEMTALVGASGSGKSTIASLLFRNYDPDAGEILIDGVSLRDWDTTTLHARMALVAQHPLLFDTSIRNNLTYGCRREVSDEELHEAARLANAHEFIEGFPAGYDTFVGDQGAQISGGQKQRLSIARAVILRPQILVLDEATSALDAEAEGLVQDALDGVMVGRTTLVIAHRLSTVKDAHQIVCMRDGLIVENGTPAELLARQGYYWSLVRRQVCTLDDLSGFNLELDRKPKPPSVASMSPERPSPTKGAGALLESPIEEETQGLAQPAQEKAQVEEPPAVPSERQDSVQAAAVPEEGCDSEDQVLFEASQETAVATATATAARSSRSAANGRAEAALWWRVIAHEPVNVRTEMGISSDKLCQKQPGEKVRGNEVGEWVELVDEPGFLLIFGARTQKPMLQCCSEETEEERLRLDDAELRCNLDPFLQASQAEHHRMDAGEDVEEQRARVAHFAPEESVLQGLPAHSAAAGEAPTSTYYVQPGVMATGTAAAISAALSAAEPS